jgi:hypothetical protein
MYRGERRREEKEVVSNLDADTKNYFLRVSKIIEDQTSINDDENKEVLIQNIFREIRKKEADLILDKVTSKILEQFLPLVYDEQLIEFTENLRTRFPLNFIY